MQCPTCGCNSVDTWQVLGYTGSEDPREELRRQREGSPSVATDWMQCANDDCGEIVVRIHETRTRFAGRIPVQDTETWTVYPRDAESSRKVSPLVPEDLRHDFEEAAAIIARSPRMAAVLARRVLADVLERYDGQTDFSLAARIDGFIANSVHPSGLRDNLHYLREMGDFSAHTQKQKDDQAQIINVELPEAEWTLDNVQRLFDYFIVGPERDKAMRAAFDQKIEAAGRRAIPTEAEEGMDTNGS